MIISPGRGYIFVHIPKTGGTALSQALEARARPDDILIADTPKARRRKHRLKGVETAGRLWKHSRLADLPGLVEEPQMRKSCVFTLVRNPWDRLVSYYHWLQTQTFRHQAVALAQSTEFTAFALHDATRSSLRHAPYGSYLQLPSGPEKCDMFLRYERIEAEVDLLADRLGLRLTLPARVNASHRQRDWRPYYTSETADSVAEDCAEDITRFGYRFDP